MYYYNINVKKKKFSTDDHNSIPPASSQHTSHSSPTHQHQHLHSNAIIANTGYSQIHHQQLMHHQQQQQQQLQQQHGQLLHQTHPHAPGVGGSAGLAGHHSQSTASTASGSGVIAPGQPVPVAGYPDEFYGAPDFAEPGQSEHYIYVTYPPELKRRLLERYGRDIYLMLLRKDMYD